MNRFLSQNPVSLNGTINGIGPFGNNLTNNSFNGQFMKLLSTIIGVLTVAGGIWFVFQLFLGAINWISAAGDKQALETARKRITNAVTGLIIVITAMVIVGLVGQLFGFDILNFNIVNLVP